MPMGTVESIECEKTSSNFLFFSTVVVKYCIFWNNTSSSKLTAKHQQHFLRKSL